MPRRDLGGHALVEQGFAQFGGNAGSLSATDTSNVAQSASNAISTAAGLRGPIRAACRALSTRLPTTVLTEIGSVTEDGTPRVVRNPQDDALFLRLLGFRHQQCLKVRI